MTTTAEDSLASYDAATNGWTRRQAAHLLWRTQHGATEAEITRAYVEGLTSTVDRLLAQQPERDEFRTADASLAQLAIDSGDIRDLKAWWAHRIVCTENPLVEKITLFWHSHFATSNVKVGSVAQMSAQNATQRALGLGKFGDLLHAMARDVAMLVWLDGNENRRRQPNENFARELLELFALGVGNYSERDIQEAARTFTGWHVRQGKFWFNERQHDGGTKEIFGVSANLDGGDVVDMCLAQPASTRFLATKLLRFFVNPSPSVEAINAVSDCLRENDLAIAPVLRKLFSSRVFFSSGAMRAIIKSPADLVLGALRTLEARGNFRASVGLLAELGQNLFEPPTVKGWEGGRHWINSATMLQRANFAFELALGEQYGTILDPAAIANERKWRRADDMIAYFVELLWADDVGSSADLFQQAMHDSKGSLSERLRSLIHLILASPRFQLM